MTHSCVAASSGSGCRGPGPCSTSGEQSNGAAQSESSGLTGSWEVEFGDGGFDSCGDLVVGRNESANLGGESLIGVAGYGEGCSCRGK